MDVSGRERGAAGDAVGANSGKSDGVRTTTGVGQPPVAFRTTFKTAIVNRKSAMQLLSQAKASKFQTLCGFLPTIVLRKLSRLTKEEASAMRPAREDFHECAVVMLDMCGFTSLAEGLRQGKLLLNNDGGQSGNAIEGKDGDASSSEAKQDVIGDRELANTYSRTMMSAKLLRLQTTEEGQAGFGAEQLKVVLNAFFKRLMSTITDHGGDVLRLAGDALIVAFTDGTGQRGVADPCLLRRAALVSALCLKRLDGMKIQGHVMHLHVALGVGTLQLYTVGSAEGGWQYVAAGEPFSDLATAMDDGTAGEMVASGNYWKAMTDRDDVSGEKQDSSADSGAGDGDGSGGSTSRAEGRAASTLDEVKWASIHLETGNVKVEASATAAEIEAALDGKGGNIGAVQEQRPPSSAEVEDMPERITTANVVNELATKQDFLERVIRRFIPPPILYVCEAEESGWFAEIGRVAVIFVNIAIKGLPSMDVMQSVFLVLQKAMKSNQGVIKEFSVDDKGTVMVGALGLPPITGSNPSARACMTAVKIMKGIEALGIVCYVGISFGPVFTASIGGTRREFMLVGDVVNTAARLMSAGKTLRQASIEATATAASPAAETTPAGGSKEVGAVDQSTPARFSSGVVVVDAATAGLARELVEFEKLGTISVKGKAVQVEVYTPLGPALASRSDRVGFEMVGRTELRATLMERASSLMQGFEGGLLVLQGEPGVGKTLLVEECGREWQREGVQTLGFNQSYLRTSHGAPFSAWKGVMHAVLLMYRSLVLAVTTPDAAKGSDGSGDGGDGGSGGGFGGAVTGVDTHAINRTDPTLILGGVKLRGTKDGGDALEEDDPHVLITSPSMTSVEWTAAQALADAEAAAARDNHYANGELGGNIDEDGHGEACEIGINGTNDAGAGKMTPEQLQDARDIAVQLEKETRVLRAMTSMSDDGRDVEGNGECEGGSPSRVQSSRKSMEHVEEQPTTKPVDRRAEHMLKERAEEEGLSEEQPEISGSTLGPWDDSQPHQQQEAPDAERAPSPEPQGEERERPSPLPAPVSSCQSARDKAVDLLPWWAGAFGAVPEMEDSPEARGFYARRFCHIFFPDNAAGATEVLCTLLEGEPPAENPDSSVPLDNSETATDGQQLDRDASVGQKERKGSGEKPEESSFNVLLGMLTIATMMDAEGQTATNLAATSVAAEIGQEGHEDRIRSVSGSFLSEELDLETKGRGRRGSSSGGGRSVVAILDDGQEMDRCSCDLVKASTKYLHQRLLVVLVSPPLPGIMTQQRHPTRHNASKRRGSSGEDGSESDGSGDEQGGGTYETSSIGSALSSTSSGSEGDYCSDDDAGLVVVSRVLPTIFPGSESPGISGNDARSRSSESSPSEGRTADGAISSAAAAAGGDGDHQAAALGEIVAPEGNPGEGVATADSIDRGGMTAMRQAAAEPAPPQGPCPSGAVESTATCPKGQEGQIQNEEVPRAAAILTGDGVRSAGVVPETAEGFEIVQGEEVDKERAGGVTMATVEGSGEEADSQRPVRADSRSTDGAVEASGSRPETASDKDGGATSREGREELNRARSESRLSRKATKRSVSAGSRARTGGKVRTSAGGASGVAEAPANTPHLQIGAVAFMEAGNAAANGSSAAKSTVASMVAHGRRDSGFVRYWNPGTIKLLDILASLQHTTTVETVRVPCLRYEDTVQLGCRHLGCDELGPLVGVALYLRSNGNPLSIIGYCNLMVERNLGSVALTTIGGPSTTTSPNHTIAPPTETTAAKEGNLVGVVRAPESEVGHGHLAKDNAAGDGNLQRAPANSEKCSTCATVFRFQDNMNVFKVLEGTVPSTVESRIIAFLGCLSAQQSFILRVMSVIGTRGIETELLEAVYPIPIKGSTLREDLHALEACRLVKIERLPHEGHLQPGAGSVQAAAKAAAASLAASGGESPNGTAAAGSRGHHHRLVLSFRDLVIHQVVYKRLSHNHRRQLHSHIADWHLERQQQSAKSEDLAAGGNGGARRRRGSFEGGKAVAMGLTVAPTQRTPIIVHHLTLAHYEQKAMIRAHLFGVKELEKWAMGAFAVVLEKHAVGVPEDLLQLARESKEFMWLCPSLIGVLKTLLAIRSGAGVSNATTKFRHTMRSSRAERSEPEASPGRGAADMLPATEEEENEEQNNGWESALEMAMPLSSEQNDEDEDRPECDGVESPVMNPLQNLQGGPAWGVDTGSGRLLQNEKEPETSADESGRNRPSSLNKRPATGFPAIGAASYTRGEVSHSAVGAAATRRQGTRRALKKKGGREMRSKERDLGGGGDEGKRERPGFLSTPLQLQSWNSGPVLPPAPSLTDANSIYSLGGAAGRSSPASGVIVGPFTNRQGTFRDRNIRPRTADGSTSPTRSAMVIFVTMRSTFDFSGQKPQAVAGSVASGVSESRKRQKKCFTSRSRRRGNSYWDDRGGLAGEGASSRVVSGKMESDANPMTPSASLPLEGGHKPSVDGMHKSSRAAGEVAKSLRNLDGARRQQFQALRSEDSTIGHSDANVSHSIGYRGVGRVRARTAATRRAELAVLGACSPEHLIISPERAAARLAGIRKAYGIQNATPFRASSLHATTLKSAPSKSSPARRKSSG